MIDELNSGVAALAKLPKADLHSHLLLSAPFEAYRERSPKSIVPPPTKFSGFPDFQNYLQQNIFPIFRSISDLEFICAAAVNQMKSDGVVYIETSMPVTIAERLNSSWAEVSAVLRKIQSLNQEITIGYELGVYREVPISEYRTQIINAFETDLFTSVDLFGNELASEIDDFLPFFEDARERDLTLKFHTGEIGDSLRSFSEILKVRPNSIQHGNRLSEFPEAMSYLSLYGTAVNLCPCSNVALSIYPDLASHPIQTLVRNGVKATISTDDFGIFGQSISDQFLELYRAGRLDALELEEVRKNGLRAVT